MAADITTLTIIANQATNLNIPSDITVLNASPATINVGNLFTLTNNNPLPIGENASPGVVEEAARSDHIHTIAGLVINGGNF